MKENIFISDLDGTLVYSKEPNHICIEHKEGKEITYVTKTALEKINKLFKRMEFVPCSMRNREQINRIDFIREYNPKYIIACNGASIYIDGKKDEEWEEHIRKIVPKGEIKELIKNVENLKFLTTLIYNVDDYFLAISFSTKEEANFYEHKMKHLKPTKDYLVYSINRKVYFINKNINKAFAVEYLKNKYDFKNIYTAGDTLVDEDFTKLSYVQAYLPRHAEFINENAFITKSSGINALDELLDELLKV